MGPGVVLLLLLAAPLGAVANLVAGRVAVPSARVERLARRLVDEPAHAYAAAALVATGLVLAIAALGATTALLHVGALVGDERGPRGGSTRCSGCWPCSWASCCSSPAGSAPPCGGRWCAPRSFASAPASSTGSVAPA